MEVISDSKQERKGEYLIQYQAGGGIVFRKIKKGRKKRKKVVLKNSRREGNFSLPPLENVIVNLAAANGNMTHTQRTYLGWLGILHCGRKSLSAGREFLAERGISLDPLKVVRVTEREVRETLEKLWPRDLALRLIEGEDIGLKGIREARRNKLYERVLKACNRSSELNGGSNKGIKRQIELYVPGLYSALTGRVDPARVEEKAVKKELIYRFNAGQPILRGPLRHSRQRHEKMLARKIEILAKRHEGEYLLSSDDSKRSKKMYTDYVADLIGIKREDITLVSRGRHECAFLSELISQFYFTMSFATDFPLPAKLKEVIQPGIVLRSSKFAYDDNRCEGRADMRINNVAVEVKTGVNPLSRTVTNDVLRKYSLGNGRWFTGENIEKSVMIFNQEEHLYGKRVEEIEDAGIVIVRYPELNEWLKKLVQHVQKNHSEYVSETVPRIHNLDYIVRLHQDTSSIDRLQVLTRPGNSELRSWSIKVLKDIIKRGITKKYDPN